MQPGWRSTSRCHRHPGAHPPNPLGLTLVVLVRREANVLHVRGLDAYDGTPVLDIKPYPDWERGRLLLATDVRVPD